MPDRILVACPSCQAALQIRPEEIGRDRECERCHHPFAPSPADVRDESPPPEGTVAPPEVERVAVECPGCRRILKVRPEYLGSGVICNQCDRRFVARPASGDGSAPRPPGQPDGFLRQKEESERERLGFESEIGRLTGRLGGIEDRLAESDHGRSERDADHGRVVAELDGQRRDLAALESGFSAFRAAFEGFRGEAVAGWEADRRASAGEVAARLADERDFARSQLEPLRVEVEELRGRDAESSSRGSEADTRAMALESRLGALEEAVRQGSERGSRLEASLGPREDAEAERVAIREEVERLRVENGSLRQVIADQAEELRAGLDAVRADQASIQQALGDHQGRRADLESGLARLETSRLEGERSVAGLRGEFEAASLGFREADERNREQLREILGDQTERHGRLAGSLDRLDAIEPKRISLRQDLEGFRLELNAMKRDALGRDERTRTELEGLRAGSARRPDPASPVAPAAGGPRPGPVGAPSPPAASAGKIPLAPALDNLDRLAQDLIFDRRVDPGDRSGAGVPEPPSPRARSIAPAVAAEYERNVEGFHRSMGRGDFAGASATARHLVALARDHFGDRSLEYALWLRNLGLSLAQGGDLVEARASLHRALDLCRLTSDANPLPHAISLIDLAEMYLVGGDRGRAKDICQQSLAILKTCVGADNPLVMRAQGCMARIGAAGPGPSAIGTVSIST